jgi:hypothetical protein
MGNYSLIIRFIFYLGCILPVLSASSVSGKEISLSAGINKTDVAFEDTVGLTVEIKWQGGIQDYLFEILPLPETQNLKIVGTSSAISSGEEEGAEVTTRKFKYTLKPTASGVGMIEPIVLKYISWPDSVPGELSTQSFKVLIARPLPPPDESGSSFVIPVIIAAILIIAVAVLARFRKRSIKPEPEKTLEQIFLEELSRARNESSVSRKDFFTRLYKSLTDYIGSKYRIDVAGKTVGVILEELDSSEIPDDRKEKISAWLTLAEKEKFAPGGGLPGDIPRLYTEMDNFFRKIDEANRTEAK